MHTHNILCGWLLCILTPVDMVLRGRRCVCVCVSCVPWRTATTIIRMAHIVCSIADCRLPMLFVRYILLVNCGLLFTVRVLYTDRTLILTAVAWRLRHSLLLPYIFINNILWLSRHLYMRSLRHDIATNTRTALSSFLYFQKFVFFIMNPPVSGLEHETESDRFYSPIPREPTPIHWMNKLSPPRQIGRFR